MKPTLGFIKQSIKRERTSVLVFFEETSSIDCWDGITHEIVGVCLCVRIIIVCWLIKHSSNCQA